MIEVIDNLVSEHTREQLYMLCATTSYKIGWDDTTTFENRQYPCLHHTLSFSEWTELNFIDNILQREKWDILTKNLTFQEATINLATHASVQFPHTHGAQQVLTYYLNPEWRPEFYGETIFYDETKTESTAVVMYKPNRGVFFNGEQPHSIRPSSHLAPTYRFTLSVFFRERNFIEETKNST